MGHLAYSGFRKPAVPSLPANPYTAAQLLPRNAILLPNLIYMYTHTSLISLVVLQICLIYSVCVNVVSSPCLFLPQTLLYEVCMQPLCLFCFIVSWLRGFVVGGE